MSAFDQFVLISYYWSHITCRMHLSNISLVLSYLFILLTFINLNATMTEYKNSKKIKVFLKKCYNVCLSTVKNAKISKFEQVSLIFFLFLSIIIFNVSGLVTYSLTVTSSLLLPLYIAYMFFTWMYLWGVQNKYWSIITQFLPVGLPLALVLLFVILELVSNFARLISLSVRLFANMVAGHIMLKLITSAFLKILMIDFLVPLVIIVILFTTVYSLELFIAILQAFVFILLLNLYLNDFISLRTT